MLVLKQLNLQTTFVKALLHFPPQVLLSGQVGCGDDVRNKVLTIKFLSYQQQGDTSILQNDGNAMNNKVLTTTKHYTSKGRKHFDPYFLPGKNACGFLHHICSAGHNLACVPHCQQSIGLDRDLRRVAFLPGSHRWSLPTQFESIC